ncbi:PEGA domain-containing protein [Myxococcota bacterium]|nr:PEGA domain-containing protein [Myxococcota bacterium]
MKRRFLGFLLVLSFPLGQSPAQPQETGSDEAYQAAKKRAAQAFNNGEFEEAALFFKEAFDVQPRGNLLYNIGFCFEKANNLPNAVRFYQRFVEAMPSDPKRGAVQEKINEIKLQLKDLYVTVNVTSNPPGALIFIDAKSNGVMGKAPLSFELLPGVYHILAELEGYELAKKKITLEDARQAQVSLSLVSSARVGSVTFVIPLRGAKLLVDGELLGLSPFAEPQRLKQGARKVEVIAEGQKPWRREIQVKAGQAQRVEVSFAGDEAYSGGGDSSGGSIWPWVTMGTGGALLLTGGFFGLQAQSLYGQLEDKRDSDQLIAPQDIDTGNSRVSTANILLGAGSVIVTGGLVWWFFDRKPSDSAVDALPLLGLAPQDGGARFQLQGAF